MAGGKIMTKIKKTSVAMVLLAMLCMATPPSALAAIDGITGPSFQLYARAGNIVLGDGNSLLAWGYSANATEGMQYPGPTLIVTEGQTVTVTLTNTLSVPASIVFPGQAALTTTGGCTPPACSNLLTREAAANGGTVTYTFVASRPGTYLYQSGSQPEIQIEMGMVGALIVRPAGFAQGTYSSHTNRTAYGSASSAYDREYLFLLTEMDRSFHETMFLRQQAVEAGTNPDDPTRSDFARLQIDPAKFSATLWFINGRNGPDTMLKNAVQWLPAQPYNAMARMHPGERVLMRVVGGGRDLHPFHHHGNNAWVIARDGRVLESAPGAAANYPDFVGIPELDPLTTTPARVPFGAPAPVQSRVPDLAVSNYTIQTVPGSTYDAIFTWTGKGLNWDIFGNDPAHAGPGCNASTRAPGEDPSSHCQPFPVQLPEQQALAFGGFWSGSQYLGSLAAIPPLQGGLNPGGGFSFMWHSHTERELTNDDVFPGGMMTMMVLEKALDIDRSIAGCADADAIDDDGTLQEIPAQCVPAGP